MDPSGKRGAVATERGCPRTGSRGAILLANIALMLNAATIRLDGGTRPAGG
jgi:hypothetical protein